MGNEIRRLTAAVSVAIAASGVVVVVSGPSPSMPSPLFGVSRLRRCCPTTALPSSMVNDRLAAPFLVGHGVRVAEEHGAVLVVVVVVTEYFLMIFEKATVLVVVTVVRGRNVVTVLILVAAGVVTVA